MAELVAGVGLGGEVHVVRSGCFIVHVLTWFVTEATLVKPKHYGSTYTTETYEPHSQLALLYAKISAFRHTA